MNQQSKSDRSRFPSKPQARSIQRVEPGDSIANVVQRNTPDSAKMLAIASGNLHHLTEVERVHYKIALCAELRLNPLINCIDYIESNGQLKVYINAVGVSQLRAMYGISVQIMSRELKTRNDKESFHTIARATDISGRFDESLAVVPLTDRYGKPLSEERAANAIMVCETKSKRRATLSLVGIPWNDSGKIIKASTADLPLSEFSPSASFSDIEF